MGLFGIFAGKVEAREVETVREVIREVPVSAARLTLYRVTYKYYKYSEYSEYFDLLRATDKPIISGTYWRTCQEAFAAINGDAAYQVDQAEAVEIGGEFYLLAEEIKLGPKPDLKNSPPEKKPRKGK